MKTYETEFGCADVSEDMLLFYEGILKSEKYLDILKGRKLSIDDFVKSSILFSLFGIQNLFARLKYPEPETIRILDAHGYTDDKGYSYSEKQDHEQELKPVKEWVNVHDGNYDVLFAFCCKRKRNGFSIEPEKSFLVWPKGTINITASLDMLLKNNLQRLKVLKPKHFRR